jgi:hypothetical protein
MSYVDMTGPVQPGHIPACLEVRQVRVVFRRAQTTGPETAAPQAEPTTLVVNFLEFVGSGWHTTADAMLANTSAAMAREHQQAAREYLTATAA